MHPLRYEHYGSNTLHTGTPQAPHDDEHSTVFRANSSKWLCTRTRPHQQDISTSGSGWLGQHGSGQHACQEHEALGTYAHAVQSTGGCYVKAPCWQPAWHLVPYRGLGSLAANQLAACYCRPSLAMAAASRSTWPEPYCCCPGAAAYAAPLCIHVPACSCFCCACSAQHVGTRMSA